MPAHLRHRSSGFTLVEVLVALMIMAVMAGMAWQGVDGIVRARDSSQERLERQLRLNTVIAQWESDLASVQDSYSVPALAFDGSTLRLTRRTSGGMQVVAWSLRGNSWMRWASPPVTTAAELGESWIRTQQLLGNEAGQLRTLTGLVQWQVYFYRNNAWSNAQSSGDVAEAPAPPASGASAPKTPTRTVLPSGVRVVLALSGDGLEGTLTRDVVLGPQPR